MVLWPPCWGVTYHLTEQTRTPMSPRSATGRGDPKSKFSETFDFALFRQGSISFARFLPVFAHFLPENGQKMGKNGQIRVRLFFASILQNSLVFVRRAHAQFATLWSATGEE